MSRKKSGRPHERFGIYFVFSGSQKGTKGGSGGKKGMLPCEFDLRIGYLTIDRKPMFVIHLADSPLVIRDWSEITEGTV